MIVASTQFSDLAFNHHPLSITPWLSARLIDSPLLS
jgi:hypothetical protein